MIHPSAIIDASAQLGNNVHIGPYSVIGANVTIDDDTWVGPHVVINGPTRIGKRNKIFQFASVGEACQDLKYNGEPTRLIIGDDNVIREGATLHRGTIQDQSETRVGSHCLLMAYTHVAHDCVLGDHVILANGTGIAGHCHVGDHAIIGGNAGVHQFCHIGPHAFVGAASMVLKDIPAYVTVQGNPASPFGLNTEGLKRRGFSAHAIKEIKQAYRLVYRSGKTVSQAVGELEGQSSLLPEVELFMVSVRDSKRGIAR